MNILQTSVFQSQNSNPNRIIVTKQDLTSNLISQKPNNKTKNFQKKKKKLKHTERERVRKKKANQITIAAIDSERWEVNGQVEGKRSGGRWTVRRKARSTVRGGRRTVRWKVTTTSIPGSVSSGNGGSWVGELVDEIVELAGWSFSGEGIGWVREIERIGWGREKEKEWEVKQEKEGLNMI